MDNIPSKEQIQTALDNAYAFAKTVQGGKNASYIPALAQVPSDLLAIAAVTVNGDVLTAGSADRPFAQSAGQCGSHGYRQPGQRRGRR